MPNGTERTYFASGIAKLSPFLSEHGFKFVPGESAVSSGGPFATGSFRREDLEIGLIVRNGDRLGCPNYSDGKGYAGHTDLFSALNRTEEAALIPGEYLSYVTKDGGDAFDALLSDLPRVIIPEYERSPEEFARALARARKMFQDRFCGRNRE